MSHKCPPYPLTFPPQLRRQRAVFQQKETKKKGQQARIFDRISRERWAGALMGDRSLFCLNSEIKNAQQTDQWTDGPSDGPSDGLSNGLLVRWSVGLSCIFFNRGIQAKKRSNFHQCPCPTFATDPVVYTNLLPLLFPGCS